MICDGVCILQDSIHRFNPSTSAIGFGPQGQQRMLCPGSILLWCHLKSAGSWMCRLCILKACGLVKTFLVCMLQAEKQKTDRPTFTPCRCLCMSKFLRQTSCVRIEDVFTSTMPSRMQSYPPKSYSIGVALVKSVKAFQTIWSISGCQTSIARRGVQQPIPR